MSEDNSAGVDQQAPVDDAEPPVESPKEPREKRRLALWQESALLVCFAIMLAVVIKTVFVQAFYIPSVSMEPAFLTDDRILVQKVSYWLGGEPERGDVVVFEDPGGWLSPTEETGPKGPLATTFSWLGLYPEGGHLVKRVIGVEGDVIECCDEQGRLVVNGQPLDEDTYAAVDKGTDCKGPMPNGCTENWAVGPVPAGSIFVMGDNRDDSADSSVHFCQDSETDCNQNPFVSTDLVVGKVGMVIWPGGRFGGVGKPAVFSEIPDAS